MEHTILESVVGWCLLLVGLYAFAGLISALYVHVKAIHRIDPSTKGAGILFRLLITPGLVALWPLMLYQLALVSQGGKASGQVEKPFTPRQLRSVHGLIIIIGAIALPIAIGAAIYLRPPVVMESVISIEVSD